MRKTAYTIRYKGEDHGLYNNLTEIPEDFMGLEKEVFDWDLAKPDIRYFVPVGHSGYEESNKEDGEARVVALREVLASDVLDNEYYDGSVTE